jgi:shikimate kinase
MRVYLLGYMGSGKSRYGRLLGDRSGLQHVDLDLMFESRFRISIKDFFGKYDESAFRIIERTLLHDNIIISTGGGTPCFFDNMDLINLHGVSLYLKWTADELADHLRLARRHRPLLSHIPEDELFKGIIKQLKHREGFYSRAHYTVSPGETGQERSLEMIMSIIQNQKKV